MAIDELHLAAPAAAPAPRRDASPRERPRERSFGASVAALILAVAAMLPLTAAIAPAWIVPALLTMLGVWVAGALTRAIPRLARLAPLAQVLAWIGAVCATHTLFAALGLVAGPFALMGAIPTPQLVAELPPLLEAAVAQIVESAAPVWPGGALSFVLVASAGLLALLVDVFAIALRLPLAAIATGLAVWALPPAITGYATGLPLVLLFLAAVVLLLYADRRSRARAETRPLAAGAVTAVALVATAIIAPALPEPAGVVEGTGPPARIDASLNLGDDLRRAGDLEVLRYTVAEGQAPYLRVATLSSFDGDRWNPDSGGASPLADGIPPVPIAETMLGYPVARERVVVDVQLTGLRGDLLPVPYPLEEIEGPSDEWSLQPHNLTVAGGNVASESYTAVASTVRPTREQAQAARPGAGGDAYRQAAEAAGGLPDSPHLAEIAELAQSVVADETNDYDRLLALQGWFRGGDFEYSLDAPVADGFDGTGMDAMAQFLQERAGYCVHYAATFAVMARTLDIPSRVVVGYLPGTPTGLRVGGDVQYAVEASQLHAWPEVFLGELGWVPFEPTPSLGRSTLFAPEAIAGGGSAPDAPAPNTPDEPTPEESASPSLPPEATDEPTTGTPDAPAPEWLAALGWVLGIAAVLALPALVRGALRWQRLRAAARGDARAAWRELIDTLIDAGVRVRPHDTPRALADRVAHRRDVPPRALAALVAAIEQASYAPSAPEAPGTDLAAPLREIRRTVVGTGLGRAIAVVAPRSLPIRARFGGSSGDG